MWRLWRKLWYRSCTSILSLAFIVYNVWHTTHLVAEETAGNVDLLAPDDDNLLAVENLLRDNRGKTAEKMALAVNDDGGGGESGHGGSIIERAGE